MAVEIGIGDAGPSKTKTVRRQMRTCKERTSGAWMRGGALTPMAGLGCPALQATKYGYPKEYSGSMDENSFSGTPLENLFHAGPKKPREHKRDPAGSQVKKFRKEKRRQINVRLTRRQRKRLKEIAGEIGAGLLMGGMMVALLLAWLLGEPEYVEVPEHYNQVYYAGTWWDRDDYEAMCEERAAYKESEAAEEAARYNSTAFYEQQAAAESVSIQITSSAGWTEDEAYMLAKIAMAEAEGEDTEGKALVILTVLNRVESESFPNTIEGVITQTNQFTSYENGRYSSVEPSDDCWNALKLVEGGWDGSEGATYFEEKTSAETWHNTTLMELFTHGNHTFYKEIEG